MGEGRSGLPPPNICHCLQERTFQSRLGPLALSPPPPPPLGLMGSVGATQASHSQEPPTSSTAETPQVLGAAISPKSQQMAPTPRMCGPPTFLVPVHVTVDKPVCDSSPRLRQDPGDGRAANSDINHRGGQSWADGGRERCRQNLPAASRSVPSQVRLRDADSLVPAQAHRDTPGCPGQSQVAMMASW